MQVTVQKCFINQQFVPVMLISVPSCFTATSDHLNWKLVNNMYK